MFRALPAFCLAVLPAAAVLAQDAAPAPASHDYPTSERVIYVEACMREHPGGGHYEMLNKCSCALDTLMRRLSYDDYDTLSTVFNAATIGGERGAEFRDAPGMQDKLRQYRKLQAEAQRSCMIAAPASK